MSECDQGITGCYKITLTLDSEVFYGSITKWICGMSPRSIMYVPLMEQTMRNTFAPDTGNK